jgi:outer membrane biogenesis lipoprotein LolB
MLELSTPFGQTQARFTQSGSRSTAWVASPAPREVTGSSLEALSEQLLGWPVPVTRLAQWLLELPTLGSAERLRASGLVVTPTTAAEQRAGAGESRQISDGHWTLEVQDWFGLDQARQPRLLHLRNRANDTPAVELRLIVETWDSGL